MPEGHSPSHSRDPASWKNRWQLLASELSRMLTMRRDLAALEIGHDRQLLQRGVIFGGMGAVFALTGLPLLAQAAARGLAAITPLSVTAWSVILGCALLVLGLAIVTHAIRKTRAGFWGLQNTLAELNEDLVWLREWAQTDDDDLAD